MNLDNQHKKILIIDNDLVIRYTLKKIFSNYLTSNLKIYTSSDGLQGLGYVYVVKPNLIIIDATLPKYSGRELIDYIKTNNNFSNTPVILLNEGTEKFENLPENYIQISKADNDFPNNLINETVKILDRDLDLSLDENNPKIAFNSTGYKLINFLSSKIVKYSNASNIQSQKSVKQNFFVKSFHYFRYLFDQILTSIYLTVFYIVVGKKDYEETIDQKEKDLERFRVRTFPAIAVGLALIFFGILQIFLLSGIFVSLTYVATAPAYAASYTWDGGGTDGTCGGVAGDGNKWSCAANWSSDIVPTAADSVTFNTTSTKNATIDASFGGTVTNLNIQTGYSGTITLARSLTVSSSLAHGAGTIDATGQTVTVSAYSLDVGTLNAPATFNVSSTFNIVSGTFINNSGTVNFNGSSSTLTCNNVTFNLVTFSHTSGVKTVSSNCSLPLGSNPNTTPFDITLNGTLSGTGTMTLNHTLTMNSGSTLSGFTGLSLARLTVAGATVDLSSYTTFNTSNELTVSSGTLTLPTGADLNQALTLTGGTFNAPSGNMTVLGSLTISGAAVFNANSGTMTFDGGTATLSCNNVTFTTVSFTGQTSTKTVNSNCSLPLGASPTIPNNINLSGTLSGSGNLNHTGGTITVNSTGVMSGFTSMSLTGLAVAGPTLDLSGLSAFSIGTSGLTLSSGTLTLPNGADINAGLAISGGTFNAPSGSMTVAGGLAVTGTPTFNANSGTITFDSSTTATLSCNNITFNLVIFGQPNNTFKTISSNCTIPLGNSPTLAAPITLNGTITGTGTLTYNSNSGNDFNFGTTGNITGFTGFTTTGNSPLRIFGNFNAGSFTLFDINNTFTLTSGTFTAPSNMSVSSNFTIAGGTFNANGGTLYFDGQTNTLSCNNAIFNLVVFQTIAGGVKTINNNCSFPLGNNPTVPNSLTVNGTISGTGTLTVGSTLTMNTGSSITGFTGASISNFTVAGATLDLSTYSTFATVLSLTLSSGSLSLPTGATISSTLTISGGTFTAPSGILNLGAGLSITGSPTFNANGGTVNFTGNNVAINCNNVTFNTVTINATGVGILVGSACNLPLGNNPTVNVPNSGTLTVLGTLTGTGTLTMSSNTNTLTLGSGGSVSGFTGLSLRYFTVNGATANLGSLTSFSVNNTLTLTLGTLTLPSGADLNGDVALNGGTFNAPSGNMTMASNLTVSGTPTFNANAGTVTLDGTLSGNINCNNSTVTFNRVVLAASGTTVKTLTNCSIPLGSNPTLSRFTTSGNTTLSGTGTVTISSQGTSTFATGSAISGFTGLAGGILDIAGANVDFSTYSSFAMSGNLSMSSGTLKVPSGADLNGALTISGGTFTAPSGSMSLSGNLSLTGSGVFTNNSGTVVLDGANQTIVGAFTFNNFSKTVSSSATLTFPASATQTIAGTLTLKGITDNLLLLRSSITDTQYIINANNVDLGYLGMKDFNNTGASVIQAVGKNITNSGNNTRVNFENPSVTDRGPIYLTNGSNISNNKPQYTFTLADPSASDTVRFQIQIDNNSDFSSPEVDYTSALAAQGASSFTVGQAANGGTYLAGSENQSLADAKYYVRIKGIDQTGGDAGYIFINNTSPAFTVDTVKPTGVLTFAYKTSSQSRDIYLLMSASDNQSGVDKMMISENSNFANATFEEYKTSKLYTVSDGYGQKSVYVKFRDRAGNESISYLVNPEYTQQVVTTTTTPNPTQVPVSYGTPIGNNGSLTDGLSVIALRVIGNSNSPLANISISIPELGITTTTDENGLIVLENVPLGNYSVLGIFNNKEFTQSVEVSSDNSLITIKLQDSPNILTLILAVVAIVAIILLVIVLIYLLFKDKKKPKELSLG